jgi:hypothetical protein
MPNMRVKVLEHEKTIIVERLQQTTGVARQ